MIKNNKNASSNLGALFNKKDTIIAAIVIAAIAYLWFCLLYTSDAADE